MTLNLIKVPREKCDSLSQPRSQPDLEYCRRLGANMKAVGQKVPIIGYTDPATGRFLILDGGCRRMAAELFDIAELLALDLGKAPTQTELLMAQMAIDIHKQHLKAMDRARLWHAYKKERGCTSRQLANELGVDESLVGDYLALLQLPAEVQDLVDSGALPMSKACLIAQKESNPDRQRELAVQAVSLSRNELAARLRKNRPSAQQTPAVKLSRVKCPLPSGVVIVVSGEALSLDDLIEALAEAQKEAKKAREQCLDAKTFQAVMRDKARR
jgi:ParB family chromosome partitioning protein